MKIDGSSSFLYIILNCFKHILDRTYITNAESDNFIRCFKKKSLKMLS